MAGLRRPSYAFWGRMRRVSPRVVFVRERGVVATNLVRSARKPATGTSSTRGGRVPGALDIARNTSADGTAHKHRADWRSRYALRLWLSDLAVLDHRRLRHADRVVRPRQRAGVDPRGLATERRVVLVLLRAAGRRLDVVAQPDRLAQRSRDRHGLDRVHPHHLGEHPPVRHHRDPRVPAPRRRRPRLPADRLPPRDAVPPARALALAPVARRASARAASSAPASCWSAPRARSPRSARRCAAPRAPATSSSARACPSPRRAERSRHRHPDRRDRCCRSRTRSRACTPTPSRSRAPTSCRRRSSSASRGSSRPVASTSCSRRASSTWSARASRPARSPGSRSSTSRRRATARASAWPSADSTLLLAAVGLIVLSPVMAAIAIGIRSTTKRAGPLPRRCASASTGASSGC